MERYKLSKRNSLRLARNIFLYGMSILPLGCTIGSISKYTRGHSIIAIRSAKEIIQEKYKCDPNQELKATKEVARVSEHNGSVVDYNLLAIRLNQRRFFFYDKTTGHPVIGLEQAKIMWGDLCKKIVRIQEGGDLEKKAEIPSGGGTIEKGPGGAPSGPSFDGPGGGFGGGQSGSPGGSPSGGYGGGQSGSPGGKP